MQAGRSAPSTEHGRYTVLLIGGYGFFGTLLARRLGRNPDLHVIIAGRDAARARAAADALHAGGAAATLSSAALDVTAPGLANALIACRPQVVVHAAGPFQQQDYRVAQACIEVGLHYVDLSDGRAFVAGIETLHDAATARDVLVVSGASSVPALSGAAIDRLAGAFERVAGIDIGISPGNRTERGLATMQAILTYCGAPIGVWRNGRSESMHGWQGLRRHRYPAPVGARWLACCDVPDLALMPRRYRGVERSSSAPGWS